MVNEKTVKIIGIIMVAIGLVIGLDASGIIDIDELSTAPLSTVRTARGRAGIRSTSTASRAGLSTLSVGIQGGNKYTWKVTMTNTGDIVWDDSWYTLRLSKSTEDPDISNIGTTKVQEELGKKTLVLEGDYKGTHIVNDVDLREKLGETWNLEYKLEGESWQTASCTEKGERVCTFGTGKLALYPGDSTTIKFNLTVPDSIQYKGKRTITGNAVAWTGDAYVIDHDRDTIGYVAGTSTMEYVGAATLALAGLYLASKGGI